MLFVNVVPVGSAERQLVGEHCVASVLGCRKSVHENKDESVHDVGSARPQRAKGEAIALHAAGHRYADAFDFVHLYVLQSLMIVVTIGIWMAWAERGQAWLRL